MKYPGLLEQTMGAEKAQELTAIISAASTKQQAWGDSVSFGANKLTLKADWKEAFMALGNRHEVRATQDEVAHDDYWRRAVKDLQTYGKKTELDAAIFFDTSVQNGGVNVAKSAAILSALKGKPDLPTHDRLRLVAEVIASDVREKYRADVLSRRKAIATGGGEVHGATYRLDSWGLIDVPIDDTQLV